jgi:type I restriction enzyme R subunit
MQFNIKLSTNSVSFFYILFQKYFQSISKRLKDREKESFNNEKDRLDIVIVVNMMLTGFDA